MLRKFLCLFALIAFMPFNIPAPSMAQANGASTAELELLGKFLFFDTNLSRPDGQACATCHLPRTGFADPIKVLPVSQGVIRWLFGSRNAPSAKYAQFSPPRHYDPTMRPGIMEGMYVGGLFWDGRVDTLEEQAKQPFLNPLEMHNPDPNAVVNALRKSEYAFLFKRLFGADALSNVETAFQYTAQAIAAYERSSEVNPFSSKYDYYLDGPVQLTEAEARGLALFTGKARCLNCHSLENPDPERFPGLKPLFTNFGHQNTGVPANPENLYYKMPAKFNPDGKNFVDLGLGAVVGDPKENGKFKIPSLRNVAVTPPYMHNGYFKTLREVIVFNNTRDVPGANYPPPEVPENVHRHMPPMPGTFGQLGLTSQEINDIVAFLRTLTDGYELP